jgi:hypothetical protein
MSPEALRACVDVTTLDLPRAALWWAARGEWGRAHAVAQEGGSREADWVHAYLHRVEGDLENARYWYGRAGRPQATGPLEDEWAAIARALGQSSLPA